MFLEALGWLLLLLLVGLISPGPNNITCTVHSAIHGWRSNIPLISGMAVGFFIVQLVSGMTVDYFSSNGQFADILNVVGLVFMTLLGLGIIALGWSNRVHELPESIPRLGPKTGVVMQFINGKEWFMVFTVMSTVFIFWWWIVWDSFSHSIYDSRWNHWNDVLDFFWSPNSIKT